MKIQQLVLVSASIMILLCSSSCSLFKAKSGCPSNGKNVGAERILSGEKVKKAKKFKA